MMIKIEAVTLEDAFNEAAKSLQCSVTELAVEIVQVPSNGVFGLFKKNAIIVATIKPEERETHEHVEAEQKVDGKEKAIVKEVVKEQVETSSPTMINDTILPTSFVSDQDEQVEDLGSGLEYTADYDDAYDEEVEEVIPSSTPLLDANVQEIEKELNKLFESICFDIETISVSAYDTETILVEFQGKDAALLIGKEGYRYKALSYMLFNWINAKYNLQLRLEIAEFLKNQEESISHYLESVYESVDRDGRAQTKILDGVLVQIALKDLRDRYPDKYVVIRSTRDGLKYIIINDYHHN